MSNDLRPRSVTVVGAGLAGAECAFQLAERGVPVVL
ncbi:MAG: FAD-dependent oxidoreductase, partial [Thermoanaerobaculia bacterium]|nr:FAD-dependent oxidoreductase [Thermoanaerobaculia bacterium]